ncbi:hypothetical protein BGX24_001728 [Mortierella sp. AD032]|nr:hypothetical protein BGX24_001728 [Mortierella sp. AD032]
MELQSIPSMIPDRLVPGAIPPTIGVTFDATPSTQEGYATVSPSSKVAEGESASLGLTPIPILLPPVNGGRRASSSTVMETDEVEDSVQLSCKDGATDSGTDGPHSKESSAAISMTSISEGSPGLSSATSDQAISAFESSHAAEKFTIQNTPLSYRNAIINQLKMTPKSYDESVVMEMLWKVEASDWTKDQKRTTVVHCLAVAKGFRRHPIVLALESLRQKLK